MTNRRNSSFYGIKPISVVLTVEQTKQVDALCAENELEPRDFIAKAIEYYGRHLSNAQTDGELDESDSST